ncbi:MAG TPA: chromosome segregation protein SMC [Nitrospiria bacterium]|nr:chromosome segregation protein SMC [Nitrospiria bacterium]
MHLKRLEIVGFKSFFDKTDVTFRPGVTAIVGPNGCGKSNIADAILWALGEQSAKNLRGDRMEDVIFNGTERRKPLGMAEVSLTFTGLSGELEGPLSPYREITITRRLFRSGESEYLINKTICRLKDVRELMIDAGAGYHAHTIIEQGKVDAILNASPMERREIIEETAGIAKYRLRKAEALRKLEATQQNLARVRDIIGEVRRQMNSLDRQAKKAERYRRMMEEVRELDLRVATAEWRVMRTDEERLALEETGLSDVLQGERSRLLVLEGEAEQVKLGLTEKEGRINTLRQDLYEKDGQIQRLESRIELLRSQSASWREETGRIAAETERIAEDKERIRSEEETTREELTEIEKMLERHESVLKETSERATRLEGEIVGMGQGVESGRQELFEVASNLTQHKNTLYHLKLRGEEIQRRREQGAREAEETRVAQSAILVRLSEAERLDEAERERLREAEAERIGRIQRLREEEERSRLLDARLAVLREGRVGKMGELASLRSFYQGLWASKEGASNGEALTEMLEGTHGMVADLIDVPPALERAIEAVLDSRLRGIIIEGTESVRRGATHLRESAAGRGVLIPRTPRRREEMSLPHSLNETQEGIVGMATRHVAPRPGYEAVVEHLLGRTLIVKDLDTAFHLWERAPIPGLMVTLEGEVIDPGGMVFGGKGDGEGLLTQKRAIHLLEDEINGLGEEISRLEAEREESQREIRILLEEIERLSSILKEGEIAQATRSRDIESLRGEEARLSERLGTLLQESEIEASEAADLLTEVAQTEAAAETLKQSQSAKEEALSSLQTALDASQQEMKLLTEDLTRHRVLVASQKERREHLAEKQTRLQREQVERSAREEELKEKSLGLSERLATAQGDIELSLSSIGSLADEREETVLTLRRETEAHAEMQRRLQGLEESQKEKRQRIERLQEEINRLHLARTDLSLKLVQLEEGIRQQYQRELKDAAGEVDAGAAKPGEASLQEAKERVSTLKQQLAEMGPVNLGAIDEYKELEDRHRFLTDQESDLTRSIDDLHEAIGKINKTTKNLFVETFNALNERLGEVFTSFFGGGSARLVLL